MQKRCLMLMIYLCWGVYAGGLACLAWRALWTLALGWLVAAPRAQWMYIVKFLCQPAARCSSVTTKDLANAIAKAGVPAYTR